MALAELTHDRLLGCAARLRDWASCVEAAARGRRYRRWWLACGEAFCNLGIGIGPRDRLQQQRRVGVGGRVVHLLGRPNLAELAEIHYGDPIADRLHHGEIVRDEDEG